jgi:hypothetical protein
VVPDDRTPDPSRLCLLVDDTDEECTEISVPLRDSKLQTHCLTRYMSLLVIKQAVTWISFLGPVTHVAHTEQSAAAGYMVQ